jgi:hypothetical protein
MMGQSRRVVRLALVAAVAVSLPSTGGCVALRAAGGALADGATTKLQDRLAGSGRQQTQQTVDSLVRFAALAYRNQAAPEIEGTVQNVLHRAESAVDSTSTRLLARGNTAVGDLNDGAEAALRGSLNQALQQLVRDNLRTAGNAGSADVDQLSRALGANLAILLPHLDSAASQASANVTNAAAEQLALRLNTTLREALVNATRDIAKTAAQTAIREADKAGSQTTFAKTATWIGGGFVVALLALALAWFIRLHQRTRAALDVVTQTVRDAADPRLKDEIKARATSRDVEPWLNDFLQQRGYLGSRRVAVPGVFADDAAAVGASKPGE